MARARRSHDVFGDGAVTIIPTPGHTPGNQSVCVELPSGPLVLAADASYLDAAMRARRLPGVVWNPDAMVASWVRSRSSSATAAPG